MSFLSSPFNFTFFPTSTFPNGAPQLPAFSNQPNRFSPSLNTQQGSVQNAPLPESIASSYQTQQGQGQSSYADYYGNPVPEGSQAAFQHQVQTQNFETYQTFPKRRKVKGGRGGRAQAQTPLTYGAEHVQAVQQHQQSQQQAQGTHENLHLLHPQPHLLRVTPIQGPIYAKNGHLPVVPLYSYDAVKNGTLYQIPILWTALSYALGLEIRGEILRGLPCIKRLNQLFCPTAGNTYPLENIERFIDENKALIKRMYGEFVMNADGGPPGAGAGGGNGLLRRTAREVYEDEVAEFFGTSKSANLAGNLKHPSATAHTNGTEGQSHTRRTRQTVNPRNGSPTQQPKSNRVDSCESTVEITTPYWAANSAGKVRAIVNTQHFEQAIQQEVCTKTATKRCTGECGCEQKYKWHRLLAYDPDNDCKGIFMDWFLFPSCCVCRCPP